GACGSGCVVGLRRRRPWRPGEDGSLGSAAPSTALSRLPPPLASLTSIRWTSPVVTSERGFTEAGESPARPRHCDGHVVAAQTPLGLITREGEPPARSQETVSVRATCRSLAGGMVALRTRRRR